MTRAVVSAVMTLVLTTPLAAQERWETFRNVQTDRQGAYVCSEMNVETGDFFCVELACEAGAPLTVEFSHDGSRLDEVVEAQFSVNGVPLGSHSFEQGAPGGFANYRSQSAAQDDTLRYWLSAGRNAEIAIGDEVQTLSLAGSSAAMRQVLSACPIG